MEVAERMRAKAEAMTFSEPMEKEILTISLGVATFEGNCEGSIDDLIRLADDALYEAKNSGRNRVSQMAKQEPVKYFV